MSQTHETDTCEVLVVRNLNVAFRQQDAPEVQAVRQLSFSLRRGETLAIVGESGSGKSVTALALMRLLDAASSEVNSEGLWLRRRNRQVIALNEQTDAEMRRVRGADLAMIFQEPMTSLNPVFTIGEQIAESLRLHQGLGREEALRAAKKMLDQVRIPQAEEMLSRYPHQLSGGMRQRVMIAMALSCRPAVLIADEPTTALDVTIQAQILQLIAVLQKEMAMGVIFITHDMGVVADIADRVLVMYRGEAVETGSVEEIFRSPQHPYTQSLLAAVPRLGDMRGQDLPRRFPLPGQPLALDALSEGWPAGARLVPFATKHRVKSLGYRLELPRAGKFSPEQARALGVPVQQWKLLQKGQSVAVEGRTVQPAQVLGAPRKGLSVVFSGDTAPCPYYLQAAHDADLLICDATYALPEQEDQARQWGHSTFGQSASLAAQARAKRLWLTHYSPMITDPEEYAAQAQSIFPAAECGFDGKSITLQYEEAQP